MKQMPLSDLTQLKKFMAITMSPHDGERLAALGKANELLGKHKLTWDDVLSRTVQVAQVGYAPVGEEEDEDVPIEQQIQRAFDEMRGVDVGSFRNFLDSIEEDFRDKKYLSKEQRKPLFEAVKRHRERRRR